ncbi:hypothetical protein ACW0FU_004224 [Vibrio vulnificus]|nr:hypothetical protein [Vibrio vulnificus]MCU8323570.1 hypothetical protein [Vibrio vulnificus]
MKSRILLIKLFSVSTRSWALGIKRMKSLILLIALFLISPLSFAAEKHDACVKYRKEYGWSKGYSVVATVISGSELNSAVGSLSRFESFSTYAVVFWDNDQASIFKLPLSFGKLPMIEQEVEDQDGKKWKIKDNHGLCY